MNPITNVWLSADGAPEEKAASGTDDEGHHPGSPGRSTGYASSAAWHFLSPSGDAKKNPKDNNLTASSDAKNTENSSAGETESETSSETETEGTSDPIAEAGFWPPVTTMTELLIF